MPGPASHPWLPGPRLMALSWGWTCARATGRSSFSGPQTPREAGRVSGGRGGCFCSVHQVAMLGHRGGSAAGLHTPRTGTGQGRHGRGRVSRRPCRRSHPVWCRRVSRVLLASLVQNAEALLYKELLGCSGASSVLLLSAALKQEARALSSELSASGLLAAALERLVLKPV